MQYLKELLRNALYAMAVIVGLILAYSIAEYIDAQTYAIYAQTPPVYSQP